jgi:heme exporter protein A
MSKPILEVTNISLSRAQNLVVRDLSFSVSGGEILQLSGSNGSGKTTILRALAGLIMPDNGRVARLEEKVGNITTSSNSMVYIGHRHGLEENLSPLENLNFLSQVSNPSPVRDGVSVLGTLGLKTSMHVPTARLSAGQKQRVSLARLLMFDAPLWLLDEPFTALDTSSKKQLENMIDAHLDRKGAVVLATHQKFNCKSHVTNYSLPLIV